MPLYPDCSIVILKENISIKIEMVLHGQMDWMYQQKTTLDCMPVS